MRVLAFLTTALLAAPFGALAAPVTGTVTHVPSRIRLGVVEGRGPAVVTPPPCQPMTPAPTEDETKARFEKFAHAFLETKNLTEAFSYISSTYKNHNPMAKDGPASALDILGPVWPTVTITPLRRTFKGNMGWLDYRASGLGEVVDRYRWEAGCIVEHWDQGEKYPTTTSR
ncbi:hypothetical protein QBC46DRAFT_351469 [Diplogelasinospora grovesii]|uniref:Uncharacterized protein n=1 Tax=Diplogelasinospora grovesii TaxID=303347 RepID=A0AAN6S7R4_9PEZI|nr:hypothetical protein QBC46DRAFT_351469 [Diplogelasinospora grovesii]